MLKQTSVAKMSQSRIIIDYSIDIERKKVRYDLSIIYTSMFVGYTECGVWVSNSKYFCCKMTYYWAKTRNFARQFGQ